MIQIVKGVRNQKDMKNLLWIIPSIFLSLYIAITVWVCKDAGNPNENFYDDYYDDKRK